MSRPIALATILVATVLALAAPAGASSVRSVPTADEPTVWVVGSLLLGAITVIGAFVIYGLGSRKRS